MLLAECRTHFQALNERKPMQQQHMPTFWPSIVVFTCVAIVAFGALALIGSRSLRLSSCGHSAAFTPTTTPHFPLPHECPNRDAQSRLARHHHPNSCYALLRRLGHG